MKFYGCSDELLQVNMSRILPVIDYITSVECGRTVIIIGCHIPDEGHAVDLLIKDLSSDCQIRYYFALNYALRKLCKVVFKSNYIHVEYKSYES